MEREAGRFFCLADGKGGIDDCSNAARSLCLVFFLKGKYRRVSRVGFPFYTFSLLQKTNTRLAKNEWRVFDFLRKVCRSRPKNDRNTARKTPA